MKILYLILQGSEECVFLYCPLGQAVFGSGICGFYSDMWYVNKLDICFKFEMTDVKLTDLGEIFDYVITNEHLPSEFPFPWPISKFYYAMQDELFVRELVVKMSLDIKSYFNISEFITTISEAIAKPFTLKTNGQFILMTTRLKEYCMFANVRSKNVTRHGKQIKEYDNFPSWMMTVPDYGSVNYSTNNYISMKSYDVDSFTSVSITKLYFCDQVQYQPNAVIGMSYGGRIRIENVSKTFFENEFTTVKLDFGLVYRVCLDDIGFYPVITSGSRPEKKLKAEFHTGFILVVFLFYSYFLWKP